ncbi:hypothetical protein MLD38_014975 [Melastoma candidum]|uniref:Uncharacterized protein n=1 Tax=Melastoma candidum TaxID=119954 RepID=A0ACB9RI89_9MYRT|nr:hypothetical protein MLD38_014975 [Melastoma candidum]
MCTRLWNSSSCLQTLWYLRQSSGNGCILQKLEQLSVEALRANRRQSLTPRSSRFKHVSSSKLFAAPSSPSAILPSARGTPLQGANKFGLPQDHTSYSQQLTEKQQDIPGQCSSSNDNDSVADLKESGASGARESFEADGEEEAEGDRTD